MDSKEFVTKEGYERIWQRKRDMEKRLEETNLRRGVAAEGGQDWHENNAFEFLEEQAHHWRSRVVEINTRILNLKIVDPSLARGSDKVIFGSMVDVEIQGRNVTYEILGDAESDLNKGVISYRSPLGNALFSKKVGDEFEAVLGDNATKIKILKIY